MKAPHFIYLLLFVHFANTTLGQLGSRERKYDIVTGTLTDEQFSQLKQFLYLSTRKPLRDTIFIKYDFNMSDCWHNLDMRSNDSTIAARNKLQKAYLAQQEEVRPQITIFKFREKGRNCNRVTKLNTNILVDEQKFLKRLLFKTPIMCGTGAIIMPDMRYLLVMNDSHFDVLYFTKTHIEDFMEGNNSIHLVPN
ncbi:MAG: hypothetical protein EAZ47_11005 [Bacteroidetes bacterium]|nr:MAG: hypothetical protein EAY72_11600 [Bacteroidota bacterium]TAE66937.1 MAG: hypothetical protein EAY68_05755 [Bacteroidota bacterium]TAF90502.1 MAG: hypothetical protein EAZ47_11005 [Bacteroidota bacterium]